MANMLDLPRELFLMVCSYLSTADLANLGSASPAHELVVQQPLFAHIRIASWPAFVKLVHTIIKGPAFSRLGIKKRLHWPHIADAQLCESKIETLDMVIDIDGPRAQTIRCPITGSVLAHLINAITRHSDQVKISLSLWGLCDKLVSELASERLPNVRRLTAYLAHERTVALSSSRRRPLLSSRPDALQPKIWRLAFNGETFPDLSAVYVNNLVSLKEQAPRTPHEVFVLGKQNGPRNRLHDLVASEQLTESDFAGLPGVHEIVLECNTLVNPQILKALFASKPTMEHLTKLEITNCPSLHPIMDLEFISSCLERGLQFLSFLKVHFTWHDDGHWGYDATYRSKIDSHPNCHLCDVVREFGQRITSLDLAVPFACPRLFATVTGAPNAEIQDIKQPPCLPETPFSTLPQRLIDAGYRYRRLIFNSYCRDAHTWDEMAELAQNQGDMISWELVENSPVGRHAGWFVPGCLPVESDAFEVMRRPLKD